MNLRNENRVCFYLNLTISKNQYYFREYQNTNEFGEINMWNYQGWT